MRKISQFRCKNSVRKIVCYGRANIYRSARIHRWEKICRKRSGGAEKSFSYIIFLRALYHGISLENPKSLVLPG